MGTGNYPALEHRRSAKVALNRSGSSFGCVNPNSMTNQAHQGLIDLNPTHLESCDHACD